MMHSTSFLLVSVVADVISLLYTDDDGGVRSKSRRGGRSEAVDSVSSSQLESKINQLEEKFDSLSGRFCEDGEKGKDGDCENICSKDHFLTYENNATRSGRVACCRRGRWSSLLCQKPGV